MDTTCVKVMKTITCSVAVLLALTSCWSRGDTQEAASASGHDLLRITVKFHGPIELFVSDPEHRLTGFDPSTEQEYNEIPYSSYYERYIENPDGLVGLRSTWLDIGSPENGDYELTVTGTGDGMYDIEVECYYSDGQNGPAICEAEAVPVTSGEIQRFVVGFDKTPGSIPVIAGAFGGGRHRPRDVDRFLSYVKPTQSITNLPSGTTTYEMFIVYGQTILPQTLKATLNDEDVSQLFTPNAGGYEIVSIPVQQGQNLLILSIKGESDGRMMSDEDELTFMVQ